MPREANPDPNTQALSVFSPTPNRTHYILLDYYNINRLHRHRGSVWLVQRIFDTLGAETLAHVSRFRIRFYGGWYEGATLSRQGQRLSAELDEAFPARLVVGTRSSSLQLRVFAELARSMLADPRHDVLHTLRRRTPPIYVRHPPFRGCAAQAACLLAPIPALIARRQCPADGCSAPLPAVFPWRKQQKLVDTMLVSDLLFLACTTRSLVVVVSTDDDMWPGIRTALHFGLSVHHIHTANRITPTFYTSTVKASYHEYRLR